MDEQQPGTELWRARAALFASTGCDGTTVDPPPGWRRWESPRLSPDHPSAALDRVVETLAGRSRSNSHRPRANSVRIDRDRLAGLGVLCPHYSIRFHVAHAAWVAARESEAADRAKATSPEALDLDRIIDGAQLAIASAAVAVRNVGTVAAWSRQDLASALTPPLSTAVDARPDHAAWNARQADVLGTLDALAALGSTLDALRTVVPVLAGLSTLAQERRAALVGPGATGNVWERAFARILLSVMREWTGSYPDTGKGILHHLLDAAAEAIGRDLPKNWSRPAALARQDLQGRSESEWSGTGSDVPPGAEPTRTITTAELGEKRGRTRSDEIEAVAAQIVRQRADLAGHGVPLDPTEVARAVEQVADAYRDADPDSTSR